MLAIPSFSFLKHVAISLPLSKHKSIYDFFVLKMLYIYKHDGSSPIQSEEFKVKHKGQSQQC